MSASNTSIKSSLIQLFLNLNAEYKAANKLSYSNTQVFFKG